MFEIFSWNEYFVALMAFLFCYYLFIALYFYQKEIFKPEKKVQKEFSFNGNHLSPTNKQPDLIGKARPDIFPVSKHVTMEGSDQLVFTEPVQKEGSQEADEATSDTLLVESIANLLKETNTLLRLVKGSNVKEEAIAMMRSLLSQYQQLSRTKFRVPINMFIQDLCKDIFSLDLSIRDIDSWWETKK
jgi:hypothetical protein